LPVLFLIIRDKCTLYCLRLQNDLGSRNFPCISICFYLSLCKAESLAKVKLHEHCCDMSEADVRRETKFSTKCFKFCTLLFMVTGNPDVAKGPMVKMCTCRYLQFLAINFHGLIRNQPINCIVTTNYNFNA
jgi:hypothetical protein